MRHPIGVLALLTLPVALAACSGRSCRDQERTYEDGARWTCSDGCNYCSCSDGATTTTAAACATPPGPRANKRQCEVPAGNYVLHGDQWSCNEDSCCSCADGEVDIAAGACTGDEIPLPQPRS